MAKLGDVFSLQITGEWGSECDANQTGTKILRTTNFTSSGIIDYSNIAVRKIAESKIEKKKLKKRDIILEKSGGTEKTPVGRVVFCDDLIENDIYLCNNFTQAMRVNTVVAYPRYVFYFMWYLHYSGKTDLLQNKTTGIRNLRVKSYLDEEIPLPSLDEQRHIAAVLDKVTDLIAQRRAQLDKLDLLVKSRFVEMLGDPEYNNKNWEIVPLSTVCSVSSSKRIYQNEQSPQGIPFLRISDLMNLINTGTLTTNSYIPEKKYKELQLKGQVPKSGDILVTSRGTLGQCYIIKADDKFYFQDGMISWLSTFKDNIMPLYLSHLFAMPGFHKQIDAMQAGSTVSYLSIAMIKELKVMIPDIKKQKAFSKFVKETNSLKDVLTQSLTRLQILKKSIMQEYF